MRFLILATAILAAIPPAQSSAVDRNEMMAEHIARQLKADDRLQGCKFTVHCSGSTCVLQGNVDQQEQVDAARNAALAVAGVRQVVVDDLGVRDAQRGRQSSRRNWQVTADDAPPQPAATHATSPKIPPPEHTSGVTSAEEPIAPLQLGSATGERQSPTARLASSASQGERSAINRPSQVHRLPPLDRPGERVPVVVGAPGRSEKDGGARDGSVLVLTGAGLREAGLADPILADPVAVEPRRPQAVPQPTPLSRPVRLPARQTNYQRPEIGPLEPAKVPIPPPGGPPVRMEQAWPMAQGPPGPAPSFYGASCVSEGGCGGPHGPGGGSGYDQHSTRLLHKLQWWPPGPQYPISKMTQVGSRWGYYPTCWRQWPPCAPYCPAPIPAEAYPPFDAATQRPTGGNEAPPELLPAPGPDKKPEGEPKKPASPAKG